jgi:hypothetical protein
MRSLSRSAQPFAPQQSSSVIVTLASIRSLAWRGDVGGAITPAHACAGALADQRKARTVKIRNESQKLPPSCGMTAWFRPESSALYAATVTP